MNPTTEGTKVFINQRNEKSFVALQNQIPKANTFVNLGVKSEKSTQPQKTQKRSLIKRMKNLL